MSPCNSGKALGSIYGIYAVGFHIMKTNAINRFANSVRYEWWTAL